MTLPPHSDSGAGRPPLFVQANAAEIPLADKSVHSGVCSPPYYGLRDYGIPPSVWGGEASCQHEWGDTGSRRKGGPQGASGQRADRDVSAQDAAQVVSTGSTCTKCGAWYGCLGLEPTPELFIAHLVLVFREHRRILRDDGTLWVNIGDSYAANRSYQFPSTKGGAKHSPAQGFEGSAARVPDGMKPKDLIGIPWMLAFALRADGWYLRQDIIWAKPNPMPESVTDRCTKGHEYIFLFSKSPKYFYDADAIREPVTSTGGAGFGKQNFDATGTGAQSRKLADPAERNHPLGRNKRSVWTISTQPCPEAHFATYPVKLPLFCIKAGTSERGVCPDCGAPWKRVVERAFGNSDRPQQRRAEELAAQHSLTAEHIDAIRAVGVTDAGKAKVTQNGTGKNAEHVARLAAEAKTALGGYCREFLLKRPVTTHWTPTCACNAGEPVPATVCDIFNGAATTAIACVQLGRAYVGIERKAEYIEISKRRVAAAIAKLAEPAKVRRPRAVKPIALPAPAVVLPMLTLFPDSESRAAS